MSTLIEKRSREGHGNCGFEFCFQFQFFHESIKSDGELDRLSEQCRTEITTVCVCVCVAVVVVVCASFTLKIYT